MLDEALLQRARDQGRHVLDEKLPGCPWCEGWNGEAQEEDDETPIPSPEPPTPNLMDYVRAHKPYTMARNMLIDHLFPVGRTLLSVQFKSEP